MKQDWILAAIATALLKFKRWMKDGWFRSEHPLLHSRQKTWSILK